MAGRLDGGTARADGRNPQGPRLSHDRCARPLQAAGVAALELPPSYDTGLAAAYRERRDLLCAALEDLGFALRRPDGAYYVLCAIGRLDPDGNGVAFARRLITEIGVSCVPAASFWQAENAASGRGKVRFAFPKRTETLTAAISRLHRLAG
jgi:aminotransferase